jgi:hypothetical protein
MNNEAVDGRAGIPKRDGVRDDTLDDTIRPHPERLLRLGMTAGRQRLRIGIPFLPAGHSKVART